MMKTYEIFRREYVERVRKKSFLILTLVGPFLLMAVAAIPQLLKSATELDALTSLGTGVMLWANIPIMLIFGYQAMGAYHRYMGKLKRGEFKSHDAPSITDVIEGKDVE